MKFHEYSENTGVLRERMMTDLSWDNYINNRKNFINPTKEEIIKLLHQLRVFTINGI